MPGGTKISPTTGICSRISSAFMLNAAGSEYHTIAGLGENSVGRLARAHPDHVPRGVEHQRRDSRVVQSLDFLLDALREQRLHGDQPGLTCPEGNPLSLSVGGAFILDSRMQRIDR